jgi:hypothetical protein
MCFFMSSGFASERDSTGSGPEGLGVLESPSMFYFKGHYWLLGGAFHKQVPNGFNINLPVLTWERMPFVNFDDRETKNAKVYSIPDERKGLQSALSDRHHINVEEGAMPAHALKTTDVIRDDASYIEHKGRMFVIGGRNHWSKDGRNAVDVWSTADGGNWEPVLQQLPGNRETEDQPEIIASHGDFLYLARSSDSRTEIWRSTDAKQWEKTSEIPGLRGLWRLVAFKNQLILYGNVPGRRRAAFLSSDGLNWQLVDTSNAPGGVTILNAGDELWSVGGGVICASRDGLQWECRVSCINLPYEPSQYGLLQGKLVASLSDGPFLQSSDGIHWTNENGQCVQSFQPVDLGDRTHHFDNTSFQVVHFKGAVWIIGDSPDRVFKSEDGLHWDQVAPVAGKRFIPRDHEAVAIFKDKLWILGGTWRGGESGPYVDMDDVWSSSDGASWNLIAGKTGWAGRMDPVAMEFEHKLVVAGGFRKLECWESSDGEHWANTFTDGITGDLKTEIRPDFLRLTELQGQAHLFDLHNAIKLEMLISSDWKHFSKVKPPLETGINFGNIESINANGTHLFITKSDDRICYSPDLMKWHYLTIDPKDQNTYYDFDLFACRDRLFLVRVLFGRLDPIRAVPVDINFETDTLKIIKE